MDLKRLGVILIIVGGTMFLPFGAAIADRLRHVSGIGFVVAMTEFGAAIASTTLMMVFGSILLVALLRPDMPDSSYQLLNHMTWFAWVGLWQPGALQALATAWGGTRRQIANACIPPMGWLVQPVHGLRFAYGFTHSLLHLRAVYVEWVRQLLDCRSDLFCLVHHPSRAAVQRLSV
ncbi:hypothetical protein [Mycobacterium intracellulare]|uniref:hypothetical protein n=1 Tax=Mycobacterium intracellulare TaxID=1767 RepID=UPI0034D3BC63